MACDTFLMSLTNGNRVEATLMHLLRYKVEFVFHRILRLFVSMLVYVEKFCAKDCCGNIAKLYIAYVPWVTPVCTSTD